MNIARLTQEGIEQFAHWLERERTGQGPSEVPFDLLTGEETSEPLKVDVEIDHESFENRFQAAEYLVNRFEKAGLVDIESDRGIWSWLSLYFIDVVCPPGKDGRRKPGAVSRHVPEPGDFQRYYRHLLAGPYRIYRAHRDDPSRAYVLLCQPLATPGDVVEQLASRQELVTNPGIVGLATRLYVDGKTLRLKRGAGAKGAGSVRRLVDVLEQFDLTWDLYGTSSEELIAVMPKEFQAFLA